MGTFWDAAPCSLVHNDRNTQQLTNFIITSDVMHYNTEDSNFDIRHYEKLKTHQYVCYFMLTDMLWWMWGKVQRRKGNTDKTQHNSKTSYKTNLQFRKRRPKMQTNYTSMLPWKPKSRVRATAHTKTMFSRINRHQV